MGDPVEAWWDRSADRYQADIDVSGGIHYGFACAPTEADLGLLGDVAGKDVVDLGCGGGQAAVALAERGATVTGVDISARQLAYARERVQEAGVEVDLVHADITDLAMLEDADHDIAFSVFTLQWVEDLEAGLAAVYRILRPDGIFVFSLPHPFYRILDPETHEVVRSYFETGPYTVEDAAVERIRKVTNRRRVSDLYNALVDAGFAVERVLEPGAAEPEHYQPGPMGRYRPALMAKAPPLLVMKARKPP